MSCENSENSPTMLDYWVDNADKKYLHKMLSMSAYFGASDPVMDIILKVNDMNSRKDLALSRYDGVLKSSSDFKVCYNLSSPDFVEASAGYELFEPDSFWFTPWKDEVGTFRTPLSCTDAHLLQSFENALHTDRKTYMQGKPHHCVSIKPSILIEW